MACAFSLNVSLYLDKKLRININIDEDFLGAVSEFVNDANDNNYNVITDPNRRGITLITSLEDFENIKIDTLTT